MSLELELPPNATNLISSLRGIGYDTQSALGDIIDNCISAKATAIEITFDWNNGSCSISIGDNGTGMSRDELLQAMRFSTKNVNDDRDSDDLGRFGMGMKSASLSQAKVLKVFSKKNHTISGMSWNLSKLEKQRENRWMLDELDSAAYKKFFFLDKLESGTLVVWEELDRIFTVGFGQRDFLDLIDKVDEYVGLTFETFINKGITIAINGELVKSRSPLNYQSPYYISPTDNIGDGVSLITVKTYLYDSSPNSFLTKCLFYRGKRLISENIRMNMTIPAQLRKNTILKIELENDMDHEWNLDITKSKINIPNRYKKQIEKHLKIVAGYILKRTRETSDQQIPDDLWTRNIDSNSHFKINRSSGLITSLASTLNEAQQREFDRLLDLLENQLYQPRDTRNDHSPPPVATNSELKKVDNEILDREIKLHLLKRVKTKSLSISAARDSLIQSKIFEGFEANILEVARQMEKGDSIGYQ